MKRILIISSVILIIILIFIKIYPSQSPQLSVNYEDSIREGRVQKDLYMKNDPNSPFVLQHEPFKGLKYFNIDKAFRVTGRVSPFPGLQHIRMHMSDGTTESYLKYATISFYLVGEPQSLIMYKSEDLSGSDSYFIPFYDETSTASTYGAGRYLDVDYIGGSAIVLDFNLAYNPYCAYVEGYSCPVPPAENRITVKVEAGEKKYKP